MGGYRSRLNSYPFVDKLEISLAYQGEQVAADFLKSMPLIEELGGIIFRIHPEIKLWISILSSPGKKVLIKRSPRPWG